MGKGILVTIQELQQTNVAKEGAPEELRWCMRFLEHEKPLVLNSTNGQIIAGIVKSEETDDWVGHKIVLFDDPNVSFGGKLVGGIRVRAPRNQVPKPVPAPVAKPVPAARPQGPRTPQPTPAAAPCDEQGVVASPETEGGQFDDVPF